MLVIRVVEPGRFDLIVVRCLCHAMLARSSIEASRVPRGDDLDVFEPAIGQSLVRQRFDSGKAFASRAVTRRARKGCEHAWDVNPQDMSQFPVRSESGYLNITESPLTLLTCSGAQPARVLRVGHLAYRNADAMDLFTSDGLVKAKDANPGAAAVLVGRCSAATAERRCGVEGVDMCGFVDYLAQGYAWASVVVAPAFGGGRTDGMGGRILGTVRQLC